MCLQGNHKFNADIYGIGRFGNLHFSGKTGTFRVLPILPPPNVCTSFAMDMSVPVFCHGPDILVGPTTDFSNPRWFAL